MGDDVRLAPTTHLLLPAYNLSESAQSLVKPYMKYVGVWCLVSGSTQTNTKVQQARPKTFIKSGVRKKTNRSEADAPLFGNLKQSPNRYGEFGGKTSTSLSCVRGDPCCPPRPPRSPPTHPVCASPRVCKKHALRCHHFRPLPTHDRPMPSTADSHKSKWVARPK